MILIDHNLSPQLISLLTPSFGKISHVRDLDMADVEDHIIWQYAQQKSATILTKDRDFYHYALLQDPPPKVIWLMLGNASTQSIYHAVIDKVEDISEFLNHPNETVYLLD